MPDRCPPREALQRALVQRASELEDEAKLLRKMAHEIAGSRMSGDVVTRIWDAVSEQTPRMDRPPKG